MNPGIRGLDPKVECRPGRCLHFAAREFYRRSGNRPTSRVPGNALRTEIVLFLFLRGAHCERGNGDGVERPSNTVVLFHRVYSIAPPYFPWATCCCMRVWVAQAVSRASTQHVPNSYSHFVHSARYAACKDGTSVEEWRWKEAKGQAYGHARQSNCCTRSRSGRNSEETIWG